MAALVAGVETPTRSRVPRRHLVGGRLLNHCLLGLVGLVTLVAVLAPLLAPHDPVGTSGQLYAGIGSPGHPLGTDGIGRDLLSRTLLGLRTSWLMALAVVALGLLVGGIVGLLAGAFGGWLDAVLMRVTDLFLALPGTLVAVAVAAALGSGLGNTFLAISVVWWPYYARIVRGEVRALAVRPHVEAARMAGVSTPRIILRHLLPGVVPSAVVTASLDVGSVVLVLASLSFLGLGQSAPAPELGADTSRALPELLTHWWIPVIPGVTVMLLSLVANLGGDAVRDLIARRGR
ncbi:ABC transporter permease subunit [Streptomyces sp. 3MP-14]|uniref:ABC transporter permease subunit n=1 Tax=Streptomyces mimosae TaxID=2586635 RepID=A0A5N6A290_9ACTN|nr:MULTISPECIES: ABC transporter permease [Streptomyces]KAB8162223.1 ABC transporter permease subunit [Streptomyces mimosae]KAB8173878.1 ABC transporter permease subunit [Streptomyces sp. 3MP-14]